MSRKLILIILLNGLGVCSAALPAHSQPGVSMLTATNLDDFLEAEQEERLQQRQHEACGYELDRELLPENCFLFLDRRMADIQGLQQTQELFKRVHKLCLQVAHQAENVASIHSILKLKIVSKPCRQALQVRLQDLAYQKQESWHPN